MGSTPTNIWDTVAGTPQVITDIYPITAATLEDALTELDSLSLPVSGPYQVIMTIGVA